jgi:hypothetical protein
MNIRRTNDPNICFMESDPIALWCYGIVEWRVDTRNRKFLMTRTRSFCGSKSGERAPMAEWTEFEKAYFFGYRDGLKRAKEQFDCELDKLRDEFQAKARAIR